jgi:hypothetical protein
MSVVESSAPKVKFVRFRVKDERFREVRKVELGPRPRMPSIVPDVLFESRKVRFHARFPAPPKILKLSLA